MTNGTSTTVAPRTDDLRVDLRGKTAIVTGAATGIGRAIAIRLGASGANVIVDHRHQPDDANAVVAEIERAGGKGAAIDGDITDQTAVDALVKGAVDRFGGLDILVNNAGIEETHAMVDTPLSVWQKILAVNLTGTFLCTRAAARTMIDRKSGGRIINISSVHEDVAFPGNAAYAASKGGIRMFMRTIALELAPHGITVNDIAPGAIETPINAAVRTNPEQQKELLAEIPLGRVGNPDEIAALCSYLASEAAGYVTGSTFVIDGGLTRFTKGL